MTSESSIEALRLVKDFIIRKGGIEKVSILKTLIKNCQNFHTLYKAKLAEKNWQKQDIEEIDNDILMIKNGIKIAKELKKEIWS